MPNDFKRYAQMSIPFESSQAADAALEKFYDLVDKAREECKITDVHIIAKVTYNTAEGDSAAISSAHYGSSMESENMLAWALGKASSERRDLLGRLMKGEG